MGKLYAILGLSKFGRTLAEELNNGGEEVLVVDKSDEIVAQFADKSTHAIVADLSDMESIKALSLNSVDVAVVALSMNLEASIMCIMGAKEAGVKTVIAKAKDDRMADILLRVGADKIIQPEKEVAMRTAKKFMTESFVDYFEIFESLAMVELRPRKSWVDHSLKELNLRKEYGMNVVGIREDDRSRVETYTDPDRKIEADDILVVMMKSADAKKYK